MVVGYLEKIKNKFVEDKMEKDAELIKLSIQYKENAAFIQILEKENNESFEAFTPRTVNNHHKKKMEEMKAEQKLIEEQIENLNAELKSLEKELEEIERVIKVAKRKIR